MGFLFAWGFLWVPAAPAAPPEAGTAPFFRSCLRDPVQTCYDFHAVPAQAKEAELQLRCDIIHGVFGGDPCPEAGVTGRCVLPDSVTLYYGRTTTRMFGADVPVDRLCVHDKGTWLPDPGIGLREELARRLADSACNGAMPCVCANLCAASWPVTARTVVTFPRGSSGSTTGGLVPLGEVFVLDLGADGRAARCGPTKTASDPTSVPVCSVASAP